MKRLCILISLLCLFWSFHEPHSVFAQSTFEGLKNLSPLEMEVFNELYILPSKTSPEEEWNKAVDFLENGSEAIIILMFYSSSQGLTPGFEDTTEDRLFFAKSLLFHGAPVSKIYCDHLCDGDYYPYLMKLSLKVSKDISPKTRNELMKCIDSENYEKCRDLAIKYKFIPNREDLIFYLRHKRQKS